MAWALTLALLSSGGGSAELAVRLPAPIPPLQPVPWQRLGEHIDMGQNLRVPAEFFVLNHLGRRQGLRYLDDTGQYVDIRTGRVIADRSEILRRYDQHNPPLKSYTSAFLELVVTLGGYSAWYVYDGLKAPSEWQFSADAPGFVERNVLGKGIRFDANHLHYNSPGHPMAGALYYAIARTSGLSSAEAFLAAASASLYWEAVAEMREVISVNDMIHTPVGGAALAESYHQVGRYCLRGAATLLPRICAVLFGSPAFIHSPITRERYPASLDTDRFGFARDAWHRFALASGMGGRLTSANRQVSPQTELGVDLEVIPVEGFRTSSRPMSKLVLDTTYVRLTASAASGAALPQTKLDYARLLATAVWLGAVYQRALGPAPSGAPVLSAMVGLATTYEHWETNISDLWQYDDRNDYVTNTTLGPLVDVALTVGRARMRLTGELYGGFAGVRAYAFSAWRKNHGVDTIKASLRRHGYAWDLGVGTHLRATVDAGPVALGAALRSDGFRSLDVLDFEWERLRPAEDPTVWDMRTMTSVWLNVALPGAWDMGRVGVMAQVINRQGWVAHTQNESADARGLMQFITRL